jgi:hypothetical protein
MNSRRHSKLPNCGDVNRCATSKIDNSVKRLGGINPRGMELQCKIDNSIKRLGGIHPRGMELPHWFIILIG